MFIGMRVPVHRRLVCREQRLAVHVSCFGYLGWYPAP